MDPRNITVLVRSQQREMNVSTVWVKKISRFILKEEKQKGEVSVFFVDNEKMAELNFTYRGQKRPTDVLAFPGHLSCSPVSVLGDVVISVPVAKRQAREAGLPLSYEITFLLIHGLLHLFGYDHKNSKDRRRMFQKQNLLHRKVLKAGDCFEKNRF